MPAESLASLDLPAVLVVLVIAASPISELRGAIPVAIAGFHFAWYQALLLAYLGNLLPVPFILLLLNRATRLLRRVALLDRFLTWLFERTQRRTRLIERYERIGLALFVAIPLPVTGAWTGSLAAVLLGLESRRALISIMAGVLVAGLIVTGATQLGWTLFTAAGA